MRSFHHGVMHLRLTLLQGYRFRITAQSVSNETVHYNLLFQCRTVGVRIIETFPKLFQGCLKKKNRVGKGTVNNRELLPNSETGAIDAGSSPLLHFEQGVSII